ncbi:MAG: hypothetical protein J6R59_10145 [Paludibacteraceae bacterium]|nr:hypothetical protein [Paludibacteraceae bacterium]
MYRVFDKKRKQWVDNIVKDAQDDLYKVKKSIFGDKLTYLDQDEYVCHNAFDLYDKNNIQVFEGDYLRAEVDKDKVVIGLVAFVNDLSAYVILVESTQEFFTLGSETTEYIEVVGNVFDGYEK